MSFLSGLCGCFAIAPKTSPRSAPTPAMAETHPRNAIASPFPHAHGYDYGEALGITHQFGEDGYAPPVPLPRYTPRPMSSIQEKTLEGDAPISSSRSVASLRDEKNPRDFATVGVDAGADADADELVSDASSAISFPSSYGNTSTATRETPPPPYSPAPSRAMSFSSLNPPPLPAPPPVAHVARPGRNSEDQRSLRSRRVSWGSR